MQETMLSILYTGIGTDDLADIIMFMNLPASLGNKVGRATKWDSWYVLVYEDSTIISRFCRSTNDRLLNDKIS